MPQSDVNAVAETALQILGLPTSWASDLVQIAQHESSFEPGAVNPTGIDPNTGALKQNGEHATGLMQTLPSTFNQYKVNGYNDITNPLDNMLAAIQYMMKRYGSIPATWKHWQQYQSY